MTRNEFILAEMEQGVEEAEAIWIADLDDEWGPSIKDIIKHNATVLDLFCKEGGRDNETV